jgi:hypothetical protein
MFIKIFLIFFICKVSFSQNAPGGVFSNLQLWFRADTGVIGSSNVSQWKDMSGNNRHANQSSASNQPTFLPIHNNFNPSIDFQGFPFGGFFSTFDFLNIGTTNINITNSLTLLYVNTLDNIGNDHYIIGHRDGWNRWRFGNSYFQSNRGFINFGNQTSTNIPNIFCVNVSNTTGTVFKNNVSILTNTLSNINFQSDELWIGAAETGGLYSTDGKISEIIAYNTSISSLNQLKISSYLALKYGITLGNMQSPVNYVNSSGFIIWPGDSLYQNNIIGIGRDDVSFLMQKQSKQLDDSTNIYIGSLTSSNLLNTSIFNDNNQFVVIGHNNQSLNTTGSNEFPLNQGILSRINREFKIVNTNFNGIFSLEIKLKTNTINLADLRLLIDDDGNFSNALIVQPSMSFDSGFLKLSNISNSLIPNNSTRYITIATVNSNTLLPVDLLFFNAKKEHQNIVLEWSTASEKENKGFFIEISEDAKFFETIGFVEGQNNTTSITNYNFKTKTLPSGLYYFRLKQIDFNETFTFSQTIVIKIEPLDSDISIFPHPTISDKFEIISNNSQPFILSLYNLLGKVIYENLNANQTHEINLENYPKGSYLLKTLCNNKITNYKLLKK